MCRAISYSSTLGVPIYIMENGAPYSDGDDDRRAQWINGYLGQVRSFHMLPLVPGIFSLLFKLPGVQANAHTGCVA